MDRYGPPILVALFAAAFGIGMAYLSVARHEAFQSHAFDLGNMDQAVWNTAHGHLLRFTDMQAGHDVLLTRLAIHVEPLLALFAIPYLVDSTPAVLLVAQALIVATGTVPAYLLAAGAIGRRWLALVFPIAYLAHPSLQNAVLDDFHAVTLSAALLLWLLLFAYRGQILLFLTFGVLAAATKEEVGLVVALVALWPALRGHARTGLLAAIAGVGWFVVCVALIIPRANPVGHSPYLGRYAYLGHGLAGVVLSPLRHPHLVWSVLTSTPRLNYLTDIFQPLGFVSLLGFPWLVASIPALLINMLSADPRMYSGFYQYSAEVVPMAVGAAALGTAWIGRRSMNKRGGASMVPVLCALVLLASVVDTWRWGSTPLARGYIVPSSGPHQTLENTLLKRVPSGSVVAAADEIEPHLSERHWIYLLPQTHPRNGPRAQYIVLDASIPSAPVKPATLHRVVMGALHSGYGVDAAQDGVLILRYGACGRRLPSGFLSFAYAPPTHATPVRRRIGPLLLESLVVHPRGLSVNRARPAIGVDTFWQADRPLNSRPAIALAVSPVYIDAHPVLSSAWQVERDSPTLDWLPPAGWSGHRTVRVTFVPIAPDLEKTGKVDIDILVGRGSSTTHIRIATVRVSQ